MNFSEIINYNSLKEGYDISANEIRCIFLDQKTSQIILATDGNDQLTITAHDVAWLAWGIKSNYLFFHERFKIGCNYRNDINGGGSQLIEVGKIKDGKNIFRGSSDYQNLLFSAFYEQQFRQEEWIYEADLYMDGPKDYGPVINRGRKKFCVESIRIHVKGHEGLLSWVNQISAPMTIELNRLSQPHANLEEWVSSGLDMIVQCYPHPHYCPNVAIIPNNKLQEHLSSSITLERLKTIFVCSKCGRKRARLAPF